MLYLVSTPIGNLGDISSRAKKVLAEADLVACEDTRTSRQLFSLLGISVRATTPYHEHNADTARPRLIQKLKEGAVIALVSDAGTPLISDPGYRLVRDCYAAGIQVSVVPGANAVLSALQLSGLPSDAFFFYGFLPPKRHARQQALSRIQSVPATLIFYETPQRLKDVLSDMKAVLGNRQMAVVREITKKFEETRRGTIAELMAFYDEQGVPKGELVLVVEREPEEKKRIAQTDLTSRMANVLKTCSVRDASSLLAAETGLSKKEVYQAILAYQKEIAHEDKRV